MRTYNYPTFCLRNVCNMQASQHVCFRCGKCHGSVSYCLQDLLDNWKSVALSKVAVQKVRVCLSPSELQGKAHMTAKVHATSFST